MLAAAAVEEDVGKAGAEEEAGAGGVAAGGVKPKGSMDGAFDKAPESE